jgi:nicotinamidase-related amidase
VLLLLIDMQVDFCHAQGRLNVPGALGDLRRVTEFLYRHASAITRVAATLDTHLPFQIFHPPWWADAAGNPPPPFTLITSADLEAGRWRPVVAPEWSREYVRQLEAGAKKVLTIWPYHVMLGGPGHTLDPVLWSAIVWHSLARRTQPDWIIKGTLPHTEHYSALQPEIPLPGEPASRPHPELLQALRRADYVLVAGEAESHCVLETLEDMVEVFRDEPGRLERFYVLQDCTSPVVHPQVDFHALALERFEDFRQAGMRFVNSTDALPFLSAGGGVGEKSHAPVVGLADVA